MVETMGTPVARLPNTPSAAPPSTHVSCSIGTPGRIEIVLVCGRRVIVDAAMLTRVIAAVEPA